jgi:hypothetical protein
MDVLRRRNGPISYLSLRIPLPAGLVMHVPKTVTTIAAIVFGCKALAAADTGAA